MTSPEGSEVVIGGRGWGFVGVRTVHLQPRTHRGPALGFSAPPAHLETSSLGICVV